MRLGRSAYQIDFEQDYSCISTFTDIWQLAAAVAKLALQANEIDLPVDQTTDDQRCNKPNSPIAMLGEDDWLYPIFKSVSSFIRLCWKGAFRQLNLGLIQAEDEISQATYEAFFLACRNGDEDVVYALLKGELEINTAFEFKHSSDWTYDLLSTTALHQAARGGRKEIIQILLEKGAEINATTDIGMTPLHYAVLSEDAEVIALLLEKGADICAITKLKKSTLFHIAVQHKHIKDITALLIRIGADVNAVKFKGGTPLYMANTWWSAQLVQLLLDSGADPSVVNKEGQIY